MIRRSCFFCGCKQIDYGVKIRTEPMLLPACGDCAAKRVDTGDVLSITDALAVWRTNNV